MDVFRFPVRYFQTCDSITEHNCELRLMVAEQYSACKTDEEKCKLQYLT